MLVAIALVLAAAACRHDTHSPDTLTVSVAASLQGAMEEVAPAFERSHPGTKIIFNFGGSGSLAQQIEHGAPVDVFLSAAPKPLDALAKQGLILSETRRDLLRNEIVLIVPKDRAAPDSFAALAAMSVKLIALGEPESVPAGDYGRQVLEHLRLWTAVQSKLVFAKDVRQVLTYVETGNAEAGIVYGTDARDSEKVRVAAVAAPDSHTPVVYPIAVVKGSHNIPGARAWIDYLASAGPAAVFSRRGFTTVAP